MNTICQVVQMKPHESFNLTNCQGIQICVASTKQLKKDAALEAIKHLALGHLRSLDIEVKGFAAESHVKEQPHGSEMTILGARNRITHLHQLAHPNNPATTKDDVLYFYISMENGIIEETVGNVKNPELFKTKEDTVWVDRCYIICEMFHNMQKKTLEGFSDGITVPLQHVKDSERTDWNVTAGKFIAEKYDTSESDWHEKLGGVSRKELIKKGIDTLFKLQPESHIDWSLSLE
jgi:non-canonical (house-cleaning) NTP pyrophosphatase